MFLGEADDLDLQPTRTKRQTYIPPVDLSTITFPDSFDPTQQWPECASIFNEIQNQGECASCWAGN
jgi:hypothetical protein